MSEISGAASITGRELTITRVFDAPRWLVFRAWTDPEQLARWWGPAGFTAPSVTMDVRPGGAWRTYIGSESGDIERWMHGVYREIDEPDRLVFTFAWEEPDGTLGNETLVTVTFADHGDKTEMIFHQAVFTSTEERDSHHEGWSECFDDLATYLGQRG